MLDAHAQIAIPFETDFIIPLYLKRDSFGDLRETPNVRRLLTEILANPFVRRGEMSDIDVDQIMAHLAEPTYAGVVEAVFRTWALRRNKTRWGDKNPGVLHVHHLNALFPDALFLHLIRDGRDVTASRMRIKTWRQCSVILLAHHWCWMVTGLRRAGQTLGERYKEIRYEDLVRSPEETLRNVCAWIGEAYEPEMLDYHHTAASRMPQELVRTEHRSSVSPLDQSKIGVFRRLMSRGDRAVFQTIAQQLLVDLQYELEDDRSLGFRMGRKFSELSHAIRGLAVFPFPGSQR